MSCGGIFGVFVIKVFLVRSILQRRLFLKTWYLALFIGVVIDVKSLLVG